MLNHTHLERRNGHYRVSSKWTSTFTQQAALCAALRNLDPFYGRANVPLARVQTEMALAELPGGTMATAGRH